LPRYSPVEIVEAAVPSQRPVSPNRPMAAAFIVLGVLLNIGGIRMLKTG
jgi:hypothetical protein